mmetsp:Transcript_79422/g.202316  ORF Transcript_79422/g.202316 Transcript_79422/m.202316 type:complete len:201 (-) Transcript_79422:876-1478(-)
MRQATLPRLLHLSRTKTLKPAVSKLSRTSGENTIFDALADPRHAASCKRGQPPTMVAFSQQHHARSGSSFCRRRFPGRSKPARAHVTSSGNGAAPCRLKPAAPSGMSVEAAAFNPAGSRSSASSLLESLEDSLLEEEASGKRSPFGRSCRIRNLSRRFISMARSYNSGANFFMLRNHSQATFSLSFRALHQTTSKLSGPQ